jgi:hypothetical protein
VSSHGPHRVVDLRGEHALRVPAVKTLGRTLGARHVVSEHEGANFQYVHLGVEPVVPQVAVLDGPQGKFVYVPGKDKDGKDVALPRPVTLGPWVEVDGANLWIVEAGLKAGETVIVDGMARIMAPGSPIMLGPPPGAPGAPPGAAPAKGDAKAAAPKS